MGLADANAGPEKSPQAQALEEAMALIRQQAQRIDKLETKQGLAAVVSPVPSSPGSGFKIPRDEVREFLGKPQPLTHFYAISAPLPGSNGTIRPTYSICLIADRTRELRDDRMGTKHTDVIEGVNLRVEEMPSHFIGQDILKDREITFGDLLKQNHNIAIRPGAIAKFNLPAETPLREGEDHPWTLDHVSDAIMRQAKELQSAGILPAETFRRNMEDEYKVQWESEDRAAARRPATSDSNFAALFAGAKSGGGVPAMAGA